MYLFQSNHSTPGNLFHINISICTYRSMMIHTHYNYSVFVSWSRYIHYIYRYPIPISLCLCYCHCCLLVSGVRHSDDREEKPFHIETTPDSEWAAFISSLSLWCAFSEMTFRVSCVFSVGDLFPTWCLVLYIFKRPTLCWWKVLQILPSHIRPIFLLL